MAALSKIKARIAEIAQSPRNVALSDIQWIVDQLGSNGYRVAERFAGDHQRLFSINNHRFGICTHNRGSSQVKLCYVNEFIKVMIELELL